MKKIIFTYILISVSLNIKAQKICDTSKLLKDLIYHEFGKPPVDYKYLDYSDYIKCKGIDTVNKLLLDLVEIKWKYEYYRHNVEDGFWKQSDFINQAKDIAKKDTTKIYKIADSLFKSNNSRSIKYILETYRVSDFNIRLCGYLDLKESIPILQNALTLPKRYDIELVKLTLAKLGDTLVESEFLNSMINKKDFNFEDFFRKYSPENIDYIGTSKGYYYYSKKLMAKDVLLDGEPGDYFKRQLRNEILTFLVHKIKSEELNKIALELYKKYNSTFYDLFPTQIDFNSTEKMISDKDIKLVIDWFEKNKGKYILK